MPTEEPSVAGLTNSGKRNFFRTARNTCSRSLLPFRAQNRQKFADRQPRLQEKPLLHVLVHAHGRADHARAHVRQAGEIEQALHRAVFAVGAVQHREDHVHALRAGCALLERHQRGDVGIGAEHHVLARAQHFRQHLLRGRTQEPSPVLGDADRHRFVFLGVQRANHRRRRHQRHFVLARTSAKNHAHPQPFLFCRHEIWVPIS